MEELVFALSDDNKVFKVHMNAYDFAIGEILMQDRQSIAFESHKPNDLESHSMMYEKDMRVIVHCLCN